MSYVSFLHDAANERWHIRLWGLWDVGDIRICPDRPSFESYRLHACKIKRYDSHHPSLADAETAARALPWPDCFLRVRKERNNDSLWHVSVWSTRVGRIQRRQDQAEGAERYRVRMDVLDAADSVHASLKAAIAAIKALPWEDRFR